MDAKTLEQNGWSTVQMGGFTGQVGPFWTRERDGQWEVGLLVEPRHANNHLGTIHGGVVMTFADIALGVAAARALGSSNCVTTQLNTHFVATAKVGDLVTCKPELVRQTPQIYFVRGLIKSGEKTIAACDGIWKVIEPRPKAD